MNLDHPNLTAYALGEELAPAERYEVESLLASSAEAREFVKETRAFAGMLAREFKADGSAAVAATTAPVAALETMATERVVDFASLVQQVEGEREARRHWVKHAVWSARAVAGLGIAAVVATMFVPAFTGTLHRSRKVAVNAQEEAEDKKLVATQAPIDVMFEPLEAAPEMAPVASPAAASAPTMSVASADRAASDALIASTAGRDMDARGGEIRRRVVEEMTASPKEKTLASLSSSLDESRSPSAPVIIGQSGAQTPGSLSASQLAQVQEFKSSWATRGNDRGSRGAVARRYLMQSKEFNTEGYAAIQENGVLEVLQNPLSTFSVDVDTASYANVRRFLTAGQRPPTGAVRIEELINYFKYDYPQPKEGVPFSTTLEVGACPWMPEHRLVRIGLKGRETPKGERPKSNLVFLIDVSGSMDEPNKLPLLKQSMKLLVEQLGENDRVAIAVYAGAAGIVLPPTRGDKKEAINAALEGLKASGSTNGAGGIKLAYQLAQEQMMAGGINRVILATDGDFNVGMQSESDLVELIKKEAKTGVYLTVLGFGEGNLQDAKMKQLSKHGNGNYAYIDTLREGRKVLVEQIGGTLETIAKDVKIQVEWNPATVRAYRLIGYENRLLAKEDFNNDKKDAGEIGAGHAVTALYEVIPAGVDAKEAAVASVDPLKYQVGDSKAAAGEKVNRDAKTSDDLLTVKLRYKEPAGEDASKLIEQSLKDRGGDVKPSQDFQFAAAVAEFGMLLRGSEHAGNAAWGSVLELAQEGVGRDEGGYRKEFVELVKKARELMGKGRAIE